MYKLYFSLLCHMIYNDDFNDNNMKQTCTTTYDHVRSISHDMRPHSVNFTRHVTMSISHNM